MTKTLKILIITASLAGCSSEPMTPEQRATLIQLLAIQNSRPIEGPHITYDPAAVAAANRPIYVCPAFGCP